MKTLNQVKMNCVERGKKAFAKAMVNTKDTIEVEQVMFFSGILEKPKQHTLRELRSAVSVIECLAERG